MLSLLERNVIAIKTKTMEGQRIEIIVFSKEYGVLTGIKVYLLSF